MLLVDYAPEGSGWVKEGLVVMMMGRGRVDAGQRA